MRGFTKLAKEYWKYYLAALAILLLFAGGDSAYTIWDNNDTYQEQRVNTEMDVDLEEQFLEQNGRWLEKGRDYCEVIENKVIYDGPLGLLPMLFLITLVLLVKQSFIMGRNEFQKTLPVKEWTWVLYDYLATLGILLIVTLCQGGFLLYEETGFNQSLLEEAKLFPGIGINPDIVSKANGHFLKYLGFYILFLILIYTWIYFGTMLARNPVVGSLLSVFVWSTLYSISDEIIGLPGGNDFDFLTNIGKAAETGLYYVDGACYAQMAAAMGIFVVLMVLLLCFLGGKREISRGKVFYFPILDYLFVLFAGIAIIRASGLSDFLNYAFRDYRFLIGVVLITFLAWHLIHLRSDKKQIKMEVK